MSSLVHLFVVKCFSSTFSLFSLNERRWEQLSLCANKKQMLLQILKDNQGISHPLSHQPVRETLRAKWRSWPCSWRADAANAELTQFYGSNISLHAAQQQRNLSVIVRTDVAHCLLHFVIVRLCLSNLFTKCFLHEEEKTSQACLIRTSRRSDRTDPQYNLTSSRRQSQTGKKKRCFFLTDGPGSKSVIVELIDFIFVFYQSIIFLLQHTVFIQGLK